jgi:hypothetical protein
LHEKDTGITPQENTGISITLKQIEKCEIKKKCENKQKMTRKEAEIS